MQTSRGAVLKIESGWFCFNQPFIPSEVPESEVKGFGFQEMFALQTIEKTNIKKILIGKILDNDKIKLYLSGDEFEIYHKIKQGLFGLYETCDLFLSFNQNGIFQGFVLEKKDITSMQVPAFGTYFVLKINK